VVSEFSGPGYVVDVKYDIPLYANMTHIQVRPGRADITGFTPVTWALYCPCCGLERFEQTREIALATANSHAEAEGHNRCE
jgi:hypothetical protein